MIRAIFLQVTSVAKLKIRALFNLSSHKGVVSYYDSYILISIKLNKVKKQAYVCLGISKAKFREFLKYFTENISLEKSRIC